VLSLKAFVSVIAILTALAAGTLGTRWLVDLQRPSNRAGAELDPSAPANLSPMKMSTDAIITSLQGYLRGQTADSVAYSNLGNAYLQKARETGDPTFYTKADEALNKALGLDPNDYRTLVGLGALANARHLFGQGLALGERARLLNPYNAGVYSVIGDAQIELGEYADAFATFDRMVDLRPDFSSYARVSYARELRGDLPAAIEAMRRAVEAGAPNTEGLSWGEVQLGNLYFGQADYADAENAYQAALASWHDYPYARAGIANVRAAAGDYNAAIDIYTRVINTMPLPQFVIALGDIYAAAGRRDDAAREYDLVDVEEKLFRANGVDVDAELALFDADHRRDLGTLLERARAAYARRPSVVVADTLAWTLYQTSNYAQAREVMQQALRLGTRNALMYYHAGMIAYQLHDLSPAAEYLNQALTLNPQFSLLYSSQAKELLAQFRGGNPSPPSAQSNNLLLIEVHR
jgi:tetratricopeptide (TPR) repeat protein